MSGSSIFEENNVFEHAARKNLVCHIGKSNELYIDIDSYSQYKLFLQQIVILRQKVDIDQISKTPSPSERFGRYHIRIQFPKNLTILEKLFLQCCLGSDPKRELLGYLNHLDGAPDEQVSVLFEKTDWQPIALHLEDLEINSSENK